MFLIIFSLGIMDIFLQRLSDDHNKHTGTLQEMFKHTFIYVKMSLYRCNPNSYHKVADCYCKMLLNYIVCTFESVLSCSNASPTESVSCL